MFAGFAGADPFVLDNAASHNDYWAFVTGGLFPMLHSTDLVHWTSAGKAMAARPSWVIQSGDWHPWGPSVVQVPGPCPGTGSTTCNVMYYTGVSAAWQVNCVARRHVDEPWRALCRPGPALRRHAGRQRTTDRLR